ncbi:MAG: glycosyltransferase family 2 protein, partial [Deltaproteobacteria bacterium]|nr:glycosyltransferase family 2 protein [Deltaproteobacteria bacterium]
MPESIHDKKVAVLVLNRDGAHFLHNCLQSLLKNAYPPFDIYLIDNGSKDASVHLTRTHYPMVGIIENQSNLGFAGAYDRVIRRLDYHYVVLLNNDTITDEKWLEGLFNMAERDRRIAACGSKILMMRDRNIIDHAGGMFTMIGSGLDMGKWSKDRGEYEKTRDVAFGCGCSLLIRRQTYLDVGGFDPDYVIYHEDVDLCWRMRLFGYSVMYVPHSVVYHLGGGVMGGIESPSRTYL